MNVELLPQLIPFQYNSTWMLTESCHFQHSRWELGKLWKWVCSPEPLALYIASHMVLESSQYPWSNNWDKQGEVKTKRGSAGVLYQCCALSWALFPVPLGAVSVLCLSPLPSCLQVLKAAISSSTISLRSLETMNWCRCSYPLAISSPPRCSWIVPPTRANVLVSAVALRQREHDITRTYMHWAWNQQCCYYLCLCPVLQVL